MPKKFHPTRYNKPATSPHPSLSGSSSAPHQNGPEDSQASSSASVNDLIQRSRRGQATAASERDLCGAVQAPTLHPSLQAIFDVPDTPVPRPRAKGMRRSRAPPGPAVPASWKVVHSMPRHLPGPWPNESQTATARLDRLPGLPIPDKRSLMHLVLKSLAINWKWHVIYDRYYLATIPNRLKAALLSYISVYHDDGISYMDLKTIFLDDAQLEDATGSESITHLELGFSFGYRLSPKKLLTYFSNHPTNALSNLDESSIPESWDSVAQPSLASILPNARFPCLTHLSLASYTPSSCWRFLLSLAPHLKTLTHLSLAHWPPPSPTPNSRAVSLLFEPSHPISYTSESFDTALAYDWSEAVSILRQLSKRTLCLKWLDLEGCGSWSAALCWEATAGITSFPKEARNFGLDLEGKYQSSETGVDWNGRWCGVKTVILTPATEPPTSLDWPFRELYFWMKIELTVRRVMRTMRDLDRDDGKMITFVTSNLTRLSGMNGQSFKEYNAIADEGLLHWKLQHICRNLAKMQNI